MNWHNRASLAFLSSSMRACKRGFLACWDAASVTKDDTQLSNESNNLARLWLDQSIAHCSSDLLDSRLTCSLHKRMTWAPSSAPTFPKLESLSQANSKRTFDPFNECRPFNCRAPMAVSFCGWAVAPRLPVTPPWLNDSLKMSWTHSRDKNEHASLATSATTDNPATDELSGDFLCSSLLSGGNSGASSSDDSSLMDGEGETSNLPEINASSIVGKDSPCKASTWAGTTRSPASSDLPKARSKRSMHSLLWLEVSLSQPLHPGDAPIFNMRL